MQPTAGRIVHYLLPSCAVRPAIVVRSRYGGICDLHVFLTADDIRDGQQALRADIPQGNNAGSWNWPPAPAAAPPAPRRARKK